MNCLNAFQQKLKGYFYQVSFRFFYHGPVSRQAGTYPPFGKLHLALGELHKLLQFVYNILLGCEQPVELLGAGGEF